MLTPMNRLIIRMLMALSCVAASAQDYPNKTIRIVAGGPGGGADFTSRMLSRGLTAIMGQTVIVDNRPSVMAAETVARALPDGYTMLVSGSSIWLNPFFQKTDSFTIRDFSPVTLAVSSPNILVVNMSLPVNTTRELIALAKARPGELNFGSGTIASASHLAGEIFNSMAGVHIMHIPYKGLEFALTDLMGGQLQIAFPGAAAVAPLLKGGKVRALAVTSAEPSVLVPGLPTIAASGLPGYESGTVFAVFVPAKTSAAIVRRLNQEIVRVLNTPDVKDKLLIAGVEARGNSPEQLAATISGDIARVGKAIRNVGY